MSSTWQGRLVRSLIGRLVLWSGVALNSVWSSQSFAQANAPKQAAYLEVEGTCPRPETLRRELEPLLKVWELCDAKEEAHEVVRIRASASSLEISALGDVRVVNDPSGDCDERARVAAVFIALRLEPAHLPVEEAPPEPHDAEGTPLVPRPPVEPLRLSLGLGMLAERSWGPVGWSLGPILSAGVSKGKALGYLSASFISRGTSEAEDVSLRFQRMPFDVGGGYMLQTGLWTFAPIVSVAVDYFTVRALELPDARTRGRVEMGPRLTLLVERRLGHARIFGAARLAWFPRSYIVEVDPLGEVFRTPPVWLGVNTGISFRFPE